MPACAPTYAAPSTASRTTASRPWPSCEDSRRRCARRPGRSAAAILADLPGAARAARRPGARPRRPRALGADGRRRQRRHRARSPRGAGARVVVKSKSMATEEIELNAAARGRRLRGRRDRPGRVDHPARPRDPEPHHRPGPPPRPALDPRGVPSRGGRPGRPVDRARGPHRFARARLREQFLAADVGITGANFAVAETGSIVLVTNEGNGRMVTTLPRVHVASSAWSGWSPTSTSSTS